MLMRRRVGRRVLTTAAVGGAAYMVGSHAGMASADQQQQDMAQNAQIADLQTQQAAMAQPSNSQAQNAPPPPAAVQTTAPSVGAPYVRDPIEAIKQLGELKAAGVLTDEEFEAKKGELLTQI